MVAHRLVLDDTFIDFSFVGTEEYRRCNVSPKLSEVADEDAPTGAFCVNEPKPLNKTLVLLLM